MVVQHGRFLSLSKPIARVDLLMRLVLPFVKLMNSLKVHRFKLNNIILIIKNTFVKQNFHVHSYM